MITYILDMRRLNEKESAHDYLQAHLPLPSYYGRNLDALNDCLGEFSGVRIRLLHTADAADYGKRVLRVFSDQAEDSGSIILE